MLKKRTVFPDCFILFCFADGNLKNTDNSQFNRRGMRILHSAQNDRREKLFGSGAQCAPRNRVPCRNPADLPAANCIRAECRAARLPALHDFGLRLVGAAIGRPVRYRRTIARQGDPSGYLVATRPDLPAANCIRAECRAANDRPYGKRRTGIARPYGWNRTCRGGQIARATRFRSAPRRGGHWPPGSPLANNRLSGRSKRVPCRNPAGFACGKLHSCRMPGGR